MPNAVCPRLQGRECLLLICFPGIELPGSSLPSAGGQTCRSFCFQYSCASRSALEWIELVVHQPAIAFGASSCVSNPVS